jgi:hypothetical protein
MKRCDRCEVKRLKRDLLRKLRALWPVIDEALGAVRIGTTDAAVNGAPLQIRLGDELDEKVRLANAARLEVVVLLTKLGVMEEVKK